MKVDAIDAYRYTQLLFEHIQLKLMQANTRVLPLFSLHEKQFQLTRLLWRLCWWPGLFFTQFNWKWGTLSLMPGFLSEYFFGRSFSISWVLSRFPFMWHLNCWTGLLSAGLMLLPSGSSFFIQRLYWALAAWSCSCCRRSPEDQQHIRWTLQIIKKKTPQSSSCKVHTTDKLNRRDVVLPYNGVGKIEHGTH